MSSDSDALERAGRRLSGALDALEAAVERRRQADKGAKALDSEVHALSQDRSRLAQELDREKARAARLEAAAGHIGQRLDAAMAALREMIGERSAR